MDDKEFERIVDFALDSLPEEFSKKLENVSIVTADWPSEHQRQKVRLHPKSLLFGLYEGTPQTRRRHYGIGGSLPDKITIFKTPLLMVSRSYNQLVNNVRDTVMHEIGHHFGLSEEQIRNAQRRSKTKGGELDE